ncbi:MULTISPECIES: polymorphic toxin type 22 domain-containing protein [Burkholderia]|nr:hypothetical protein [Burkholderia sp. AU36459]MCA8244956.1 hypothetical protein [Burkholderia sp. AU32262]MDF3101653.1 hypothetical protein [Burkholderia semiarida]MDF3114583.1 hypothetical protein [Burkholderia semiarida]
MNGVIGAVTYAYGETGAVDFGVGQTNSVHFGVVLWDHSIKVTEDGNGRLKWLQSAEARIEKSGPR